MFCNVCQCEKCESYRQREIRRSAEFSAELRGKRAGEARIDVLQEPIADILHPSIPEGEQIPQYWMIGYLDGLRILIDHAERTVRYSSLEAYAQGHIQTRLSK